MHYRAPRRRRDRKIVENVFDEIMAENFAKLKKETCNLQRLNQEEIENQSRLITSSETEFFIKDSQQTKV